MGTGFHDLEVWREAKNLAVEIYRSTANLNDYGLRGQLRRAAVSVPSNIAAEVGLLSPTVATLLQARATVLAKRIGALIKSRSASIAPGP